MESSDSDSIHELCSVTSGASSHGASHVEFTLLWGLFAVPQTADLSTHTKHKAACQELSTIDTISFHSETLLISNFCPVCSLSPDGALISLTLLTLLAYSPAGHRVHSFLKYDISWRSGQESLLDCLKVFLYPSQSSSIRPSTSASCPRVPTHLIGLNSVSCIQSHSYLPKMLSSLSPDTDFQLGKLLHVPLMQETWWLQ